MNLRIKICGITQVEQGRAIAQLGATALGFICARKSPRYVSPEQIRAIVLNLPIDAETGEFCCDRIGVFVNASLEEICQTVAIGHLSGVQLHGSEPPEFCDRLRQALPQVEIIRALRVSTHEILTQATLYKNRVDALLLDAYDPNLPGGTGKTLNWQALQNFRPGYPWLLAGGLTPDNVLEALSQVSPHGIDLSSGVERTSGDKDLDKVARLFDKLHPRTQNTDG
ncbi:phosphoribosylanthranilate isomerase [Kovacikia minuta CCNUW1]|uniref:phosphoribosylanthranilate isomerase n=1 Tax=Kovacikia minuta TaxID=2931930 RepID=UPI001CC9495D|nr:phosphoribosylanthranilate isomerase [Kovacikia minuta]UBF26342.1 phosphoribosylanthranilate isomerase [Kovacikia minuta CCNUW1]